MKVLVLSHMYPVNCNPVNGIFVHEQVKALSEAGIKVRVVSPKPWAPWPIKHLSKKWKAYSEIPEQDDIDGIPVYYPKYLTYPKGLFFASSGKHMYRGIRDTVAKIHKEFPFDIIHAHVALPDGNAASMLARDFGCPFVVTIHGQVFQQTIFRNHNCRNEIGRTLRRADKVITVSTKLKRIGMEAFPEVKEKILVVSNGIDPKEIEERGSELQITSEKAKPIVLSVSNLIETKGIDLNLKAIAKLREKYPDIQYTVVGDGHKRKALEDLTSQLGLEKHVKFVGRVDHKTVFSYMSKCDVFSLPSWKEGFGVVYLEAMACGKPVIGCRGEGIEDFVEDKVNGLLVQPKDPDSLAEAMDFLLSHPEEREKIEECARKLVFEKYTWAENAKKTIATYRAVMRKGTL